MLNKKIVDDRALKLTQEALDQGYIDSTLRNEIMREVWKAKVPEDMFHPVMHLSYRGLPFWKDAGPDAPGNYVVWADSPPVDERMVLPFEEYEMPDPEPPKPKREKAQRTPRGPKNVHVPSDSAGGSGDA